MAWLARGRLTVEPVSLPASAFDGTQPAYRIESTRHRRMVRVGRTMIDACLDDGVIAAGDRRRSFIELTLGLARGSVGGLGALARRSVDRFGAWVDGVSPHERGARLASGHDWIQPRRAVVPALHAGLGGDATVRRIVACCLDQIVDNASEVAAGSDDPGHVHQLRVGIRRLRTALRELPGLAGGLDPAWLAAMVTTFRALGACRDEVTLDAMADQLVAAGAPLARLPRAATGAAGGHRGDGERPAVAAAIIRDAAFQHALLGLRAFAEGRGDAGDEARGEPSDAMRDELRSGTDAATIDAAGGDSPVPAAPPHAPAPQRLVARRLDRLHRLVARDARRFETLEPVLQHRARKRLKRLRYLAEFTAPLFARRKVDAWLKRVSRAQEIVGRHNDAAVALARFELAAREDPRAWFAVGWLRAQQAATARAARRALRRATKADPYW